LRVNKYYFKRTPIPKIAYTPTNKKTTDTTSNSEEEPVFCPYGHLLQEAFLPPGLDTFCPNCDDVVSVGSCVLACFTCLPCTKENAEGNHYTAQMIACCKECWVGDLANDEVDEVKADDKVDEEKADDKVDKEKANDKVDKEKADDKANEEKVDDKADKAKEDDGQLRVTSSSKSHHSREKEETQDFTEIPIFAPRGAKKASPPKETTAAKRVDHRSRSPCAQRSRTPQAVSEGIEKRDRSQSRKSEDVSSSRSTSSSKKRNNDKKTTPKSRSRSRATQARSPIRDRHSTSRTAIPQPPPCEDRAAKKLGMRLDCIQPQCELGHVLSFPRITHLAPYVQPQCRYCPRRFIKGSPICVCHQCEPMFLACVRCTFNLPNTDDDTN
jgi:hypothetical protein